MAQLVVYWEVLKVYKGRSSALNRRSKREALWVKALRVLSRSMYIVYDSVSDGERVLKKGRGRKMRLMRC